jgi:hypothetical protein
MANDFTGRILKITTTGTIPLANFKVKGGLWTGMTAGAQTFSLTDVAGRTYTWTSDGTEAPISIYEMGWFSGPALISGTFTGEIDLYLGTK